MSKCVVAAVAVLASGVCADTVQVQASRDNTLYQSATGHLSNALGSGFFVGKNAVGLVRRGLIRFDIPGAVPPGSQITSAVLSLNLSQTIAADVEIGLYRSLKDWGEGTSNADPGMGGGGAFSTEGDATWLHTFSATQFWGTPGGSPIGPSPDYAGTASATAVVGASFERYEWGPTAALVADVQGWLDTPAGNYGWFLIGGKGASGSAKRFDSRENIDPATRPVLIIEYTPPPPACYPNCDGSTVNPCLNVSDFGCFLNAFAGGDSYANCDGSTTPPVLNVQDFSCFLNAFAAGCSSC
jgi:hypothetical protein